MVECEFEKMSVGQSRTVVLIDTWWNVNLYEIFVPGLFINVLIDTWWNVNKF